MLRNLVYYILKPFRWMIKVTGGMTLEGLWVDGVLAKKFYGHGEFDFVRQTASLPDRTPYQKRCSLALIWNAVRTSLLVTLQVTVKVRRSIFQKSVERIHSRAVLF